MDYSLVEIARRMENLIRPGIIEEANYNSARVRVRSGKLLTQWLPWLTFRAGNDRTWWAPEIGEQVVLLAPSGDPAQGFVLPATYQSTHPANGSDKNIHRVDYSNGGFFEHNRTTGKLKIHAEGDIDITATGNIVINGSRIDIN